MSWGERPPWYSLKWMTEECGQIINSSACLCSLNVENKDNHRDKLLGAYKVEGSKDRSEGHFKEAPSTTLSTLSSQYPTFSLPALQWARLHSLHLQCTQIRFRDMYMPIHLCRWDTKPRQWKAKDTSTFHTCPLSHLSFWNTTLSLFVSLMNTL